MKLYTRTGDDGSTGLVGGARVRKDDPRIEAYGTVDELNCCLGLALACCRHDVIRDILTPIQSRLFDLGADLATPRGDDGRPVFAVPTVEQRHIEEMEGFIDQATAAVPTLKHFILPGGGELASRLHVARTVCRRAERLTIHLGEISPIGELPVMYLNRLSDLLFSLARWANQIEGVDDVPWIAEKPREPGDERPREA